MSFLFDKPDIKVPEPPSDEETRKQIIEEQKTRKDSFVRALARQRDLGASQLKGGIKL